MSRIRWHHYYFFLALFDVVIILLSLHLHGRTMASAASLIAASADLDEQSRWLQLAQQRLLELNAPGNDLFKMEDYELQHRRFQTARNNMGDVLARGGQLKTPVQPPTAAIDGMVAAANEIFTEFRSMEDAGLEEPSRRQAIARAGKSMARMDAMQHEALGALGHVFRGNAARRDQLLLEHESDLQARAYYERYFISAIMVILVGILWFGRRLQSHERELREERRRLHEERRERLAAVGELCSSVAHGIRNPLAAIRSSAQLTLQLGHLDESSKGRLQDIVEEGKRLGDRVTGLLSMARASREGFELLNLAEVVLCGASQLRQEFIDRGLTVETNVGASDLPVYGDRHQLEQVVIELLSNALDHAKPGDRIQVSCERPLANGTAVVEVLDEGPGVPREVEPRIFDLFFTTRPGGTGIGLATIKRYARLHGGDVNLMPSGKGARFRVTLPVAGAAMDSKPASGIPAGVGAGDPHDME